VIFATLPAAPRGYGCELAAELRAGQAVRATRSDLALDAIRALGRFVVHGGRSTARLSISTPSSARSWMRFCRRGHFSAAEAAFRRREIEDYYLFPAGRLKDGEGAARQGKRVSRSAGQRFGTCSGRSKGSGCGTPSGSLVLRPAPAGDDLAQGLAQDARVLTG
jgi:hypothetical protein